MTKLEINLDSTSLGSSGCILNFIRTTVGEPSDPSAGAYRQRVNKVSMNYGIATHKFIDLMYKTRGDMRLARDVSQEWFIKTPHHPDQKKPWLSDPRHLLTTCFQVWTLYVQECTDYEVLSIPGECPYCKGTGVSIVPSISEVQGEYNGSIAQCKSQHCVGGKNPEQAATECNFSILLYEDDYIKVNLCGTIDRIGKFRGGCYCIRDWKTTGSRSDNQYAKNEYFSQYELSRQLRVYTLACKLMAERYPKSVMGQVGLTHMGAAIDAVFLKPNANETECQMSIVFQYSNEEIDRFRVMLMNFCMKLSRAVQMNEFLKEGIMNGTCEQKWGRCPSWNVCKVTGESATKAMLEKTFKRQMYTPLNFND